MNAGALPHLTDINVRRLNSFQEAVDREFARRVTRHKTDIDRQSAYFKRKFSIIARDIRRSPEHMPEQETETNPVDIATAETTPPADTDAKIDMPDDARPHPAEKPFRDYSKPLFRKDRKISRHKPRLRRASPANDAPPPLPSVPQEDQEDRELRELERRRELEELHVLRELEKFEELQRQRQRQELPDPLEIPEPQKPEQPETPPVPHAPQEPQKPEGAGFSFKRLFDLSPRFAQAEDGGDQET